MDSHNTRTTGVDILLVEDDPHDLELTLRALKSTGTHYNTVSVRDGVEALDYLFVDGKAVFESIHDLPRLMLVDLKLPRVTGLELIKTVKEHSVLNIIPIVVFSSSNQEQDIVTAYKNGANSYIIKPVRFENYSNIIASITTYWLSVNRFINK